jgi:cell division protein FtsL
MVPVSYTSHIPTRNRKSSAVKLGAFSGRFIAIFVLAVLALLYIAQASQGATKRVTAQELNTKVDDLTQEQNQLQFEALRLQSFDTIAKDAPTLGLTPVTTVENKQ